MGKLANRLIHAATLRHWRQVAQSADRSDLSSLQQQRSQARALRAHLDRLIHVADGRLALPRNGTAYFERPHGTDWSWRPDLWRGPLHTPGIAPARNKSGLGDQVTVFHDCPRSELALHQMRNQEANALAPFGLRVDVLGFSGSFLSVVIDLPSAAAQGLTRSHLIRLDMIAETEKPTALVARLNIRHGPNTERISRQVPLDTPDLRAEFDLAYCNLNENRVHKLWLDLFIQDPEMNQVTLRDLTFARHRRAAL